MTHNNTQQQLRLGVVGRAYAGSDGGDSSSWTRQTAVCDLNLPLLEKSRQAFPHIHHYADYRELVNDPEVDIVSVVTPNDSHAEIALAALRAGKHVFCEKPMAITREDCVRMLQAEQASGKRLGIDFELRYSHITGIRPKAIIDSGEIGEIRHMHVYHPRGGWLEEKNGIWRVRPQHVGGMALMELCHPFDLMRYWCGEVTAVQAFSAPNALAHYLIPDNMSAFLFFANGALGEVTELHTRSAQDITDLTNDADIWRAGGHEDTITVVGSKGSLCIDIWRQRILVLHFNPYPAGSHGVRVETARVEDHAGLGWTRAAHDTPGFFQDFARRIVQNEPPLMTAEDSFRSHVICFAAEESATTDFRRIELDYSW